MNYLYNLNEWQLGYGSSRRSPRAVARCTSEARG